MKDPKPSTIAKTLATAETERKHAKLITVFHMKFKLASWVTEFFTMETSVTVRHK
jgi:hypothetical protein